MTDTVLMSMSPDGATALVTLNRPAQHNAFDENVIARLHDIFAGIARDPHIRAVVLRGNGKSFSAGADLNWMQRAAGFSPAENKADGLRLAEMLQSLYTLPQLTIACVEGAAFGGGMGLACCCDVVLATPAARFALSEVRMGLVPATIGPYVAAAIGARHMRRFAQTAERISAEKAREIGLVHEILPDAAALDAFLQTLLEAAAANAPQAMRTAKALCAELANHPEISPALTARTAELIAETRARSEAREGLAAFLEKRAPDWNQ